MKPTSEEFVDSNERYVLTLRRGDEWVRFRLTHWQVLKLWLRVKLARLTGRKLTVNCEEFESSDSSKNS